MLRRIVWYQVGYIASISVRGGSVMVIQRNYRVIGRIQIQKLHTCVLCVGLFI